MPQLASYEEVKAGRKQREVPGGLKGWRTEFIKAPDDVLDHPMAFLAEDSPNNRIGPHFHEVDQFQVVVIGGGVIGKHKLSINGVHFARAHTPYGPIIGDDRGVGFLTLRAHWDRGAQYLPECKEKLLSVAGRNPWQATENPNFEGEAEINVHTFSEIRDEYGLAAYSLKLKPGIATHGPAATTGNGQFVIVTKGSISFQNKEYKPISVGFIKPHEVAFPIVAGPEGVEALVLNFPRRANANAPSVKVSSNKGFRVWQCALCAFLYDEAKGMPEYGILAGTRWEDVPHAWNCPDCAASKSDFDMVVVD